MIEKTKEKKKTHMLYENEREGQIDFFNNYQIMHKAGLRFKPQSWCGVYKKF